MEQSLREKSEELFREQQEIKAGEVSEEKVTPAPAPKEGDDNSGEKKDTDKKVDTPVVEFDVKALSTKLGFEIGSLDDIKDAYGKKAEVEGLRAQLSEYESIANESFDISKFVSPETLKAETLKTKIPSITFDAARKVASGESLSDLDYLVLSKRIKNPDIKLGDAELKEAILEGYDLSEEDLVDFADVKPGKRLRWSEEVASARSVVAGVLSDIKTPTIEGYAAITEKRKAQKQEMDAKVEIEYKPFAEEVAKSLKSFNVKMENDEFSFPLPDDFVSQIPELVVNVAKMKGELLTKESGEKVWKEANALVWATFGHKMLESYGKTVASRVMAEADAKYGHPTGGVKSIENADAGAGDSQMPLHTIAAKPVNGWG